MIPLNEDLIWRRNAPEQESFILYADDGTTPLNLTGYGFRLQVRLYPGEAFTPVIDLGMAVEGSPGFFMDDAAGGAFTLTPPTRSQLLDLPPPADVTAGQMTLPYDWLLVGPDGAPEPFREGNLILLSGVTRI